MARMPVEALEQVLRDARGRIAADRLYNWLGVFSDNGCDVLDGDVTSLRFGLEWDAEALKALIAYAVETCVAGGKDCADVVDRRLLGARPFGYGRWCVEMARAATDPRAASFYLRELHDCVTDGRRADGLSVENARACLAGNEALLREFDGMSEPAVVPVSRHEAGKSQEATDGTREERPATRPAATASSSISETPKVEAGYLHRAAEAYLGTAGHSKGTTLRQRLADFARGSPESVDVLLAAMEGTVKRGDLPDCEDVVRLFDDKMVNLLVLPLMAGLHNLEQSGRLAVGDLNEGQVRLAVTILLHASPTAGRSRQRGRIRHVSAGVVSSHAARRTGIGGRCSAPYSGAEARDRVTTANGAARNGERSGP